MDTQPHPAYSLDPRREDCIATMVIAGSEQRAYEAIRESIASGEYASGKHLRAGELATKLGLSRTPVREALRRLNAEGLVDFHHHRGAFVSDATAQDIDEVFGLRIVLESYAASRAARNLSAAEIEQLKLLTDEMERGAGNKHPDVALITSANEKFHEIIIGSASNRRLASIINSVTEQRLVARTFHHYAREQLKASIAHHRELIQAFNAHDESWAAAIMRCHLHAAHKVHHDLRDRTTASSSMQR